MSLRQGPKLLALGFLALVPSLGARAWADDEEVCEGPVPLGVDVEPTPWDAALERRVTEQLFSELKARPPCPAAPKAGQPVPIHVEVHWLEPAAKARVLVELRSPHKDYQALRDIDVERMPTDGVPLAIAIAADELLRALAERARQVPEPTPPAPVVVEKKAPAVLPPAERPKARERFGVGLAATLDAYTSGLVLVGPDAVVGYALAPYVDVGARLGLRSVVAFDRPDDERSGVRSALTTGAWVRIGLNRAKDALGVAASLEADGLWVRATLPQATTLGTTLVKLGVAAWAPLAPKLRIFVDAGVGAPLSPITFEVSRGAPLTAVNGLVTSTSLGIASAF